MANDAGLFAFYDPISGMYSDQHGQYIGNFSQALVTATGGITPRTIASRFGEIINIKDFGAVCDGITNDSLAFEAAFEKLGILGGTVEIPYNAKCLIDTALTVPSGISIIGPRRFLGTPGNNLSNPYNNLGGSLIINPLVSISLSSGSGISGCLIYRKGITFPSVDSILFSGTAITGINDDYFVVDSMILGFNKAIYSTGVQRPRLMNLYLDNNNGIEIANCTDICRIENVHAWPFVTINGAISHVGLERPGTAISLHDVADYTKITNCFTYGYSIGFNVFNASSVIFIGCAADNTSTGVSIYQNIDSTGFKITGPTTWSCRLIGCQSSAQELYGIYVDVSTGNSVRISGSHISFNNQHGIYVNSGDVMVGGSSIINNCNINGISINNVASRVTIDNSVRMEANAVPINAIVATSEIYIDRPELVYANGSALYSGINWTVKSIASIDPLPLPTMGNAFRVTGTTSFGLISGGWPGRTIRLLFSGVLTLFSSTGSVAAMRLSGAANYVSSNGSSITLMHDGNQWYEIGRSA